MWFEEPPGGSGEAWSVGKVGILKADGAAGRKGLFIHIG